MTAYPFVVAMLPSGKYTVMCPLFPQLVGTGSTQQEAAWSLHLLLDAWSKSMAEMSLLMEKYAKSFGSSSNLCMN